MSDDDVGLLVANRSLGLLYTRRLRIKCEMKRLGVHALESCQQRLQQILKALRCNGLTRFE